jgi:ABC-2 type transport system ATP-binding protein
MAGTKAVREGRQRRHPAAAPIEVDHLTKVYDGRKVLDDLTFDVDWGKVTGFLGPNGAGKTTTLRIILGLTKPTAGRATVFGQEYADLAKPKRTVGAVLDGPSFHPRMTGRRHLRFLAQAAGVAPAHVEDVLRIVKLDGAADRRIGGYSLGMLRRLSLAAAVLGAPRVLLLDEPANGLDPAGIRWLRGALRTYAERGNAVLVSSHVLAEIAEIADDVVVINEGRLVTKDSVDALVGKNKDLEDVFFELLDQRKEA